MPTLARLVGALCLAITASGCFLDGLPGTLPPTAGVLALAKYGTYPGTTPTAFYAHSAKLFSTQAKSGSIEMLTDDDVDKVQAHYEALAKQDGWTFYSQGPSQPSRFCHLTRGKAYVQATIYPQAAPAPAKATPTPGPNDLPADPPKPAKPGSTIMLFVQEKD